MNHLRYSEIDNETGAVRTCDNLASYTEQGRVFGSVYDSGHDAVASGTVREMLITGNSAALGGAVIASTALVRLQLGNLASSYIQRIQVQIAELPLVRWSVGAVPSAMIDHNRNTAGAVDLWTSNDGDTEWSGVWPYGGTVLHDVLSPVQNDPMIGYELILSTAALRAAVPQNPAAHAAAGYVIRATNLFTSAQTLVLSPTVTVLDNS